MTWNILRVYRSLRGRELRRPRPRCSAGHQPVLEQLERRDLPATVFWAVDTSGDWIDPAKWSTGSVPGPNDDVVISRSVPVTVTLSAGDQSVHSLESNNQGTLVLSGGSLTLADASTAAGPFTLNSGAAMNVQGGVLSLQGPTVTDSGGAITVAAGAAVDLTGCSAVTYIGTFTATGGGSVFLGCDSGQVNGSQATFDFPPGMFVWSVGTINGLRNTGSMTWAPETTPYVSNPTLTGVLDNHGTVVVKPGNPAAPLVLVGSATITNEADGLFDLQGDSAIGNDGRGQSTFTNLGTLRKSAGTGTASIGLSTLTNSGTAQVTSGRLELAAALTNGGLLAVEGGQLALHGPSVTNTRSGTVQVNSGGLELAAAFTNDGLLDVEGGQLTLDGPSVTSNSGAIKVAAGAALDLTGGSTVAYVGTFTGSGGGSVLMDRDGSVLKGSQATFDFAPGMFRWSADTISNLTNRGFMIVDPAVGNGPYLAGTLDNSGTVVHNAVQLHLQSFATILNEVSGIYDFQADGNINSDNSDGIFTNRGTLRKSGGSGQAQVFAAVTNGGSLDLAAGVLAFTGPTVTSNGGSITVAAGAALDLTGSRTVAYAGTFTGSGGGSVRLGNESGVLNGSQATFDFAAGMFQWSAGTLTGLTNAGFMTVDPATANGLWLTGTLDNSGTIVHTAANGGTQLNLLAGVTIVNEASGTYDLKADGIINSPDSYKANFDNRGLLRKSAGSGTATLQWVTFTSSGTVEASSGALWLRSNLPQLSAQTLSGGSWIVEAGAGLDLNGASITTNKASVTLSGSGSTFAAIDGLISNAGSFNILGGRSFTTLGDMSNTGNLIVGPGSTLTVAGKYTQTASGTLTTQLGGSPGSGQFGQLHVSGQASLDGTFGVSLTNGFAPRAGDQFTVMTFASRSGNFATLTGLTAGRLQLLEVVPGASSVIVQSLVDGADLAVQSISVPNSGISGQNATFSYTVRNTSAGPTLPGAWLDSVYLSLSDTFDPSARLIKRVQHNGVVAGNSAYTETLTAPLPGVVPGNYRVIVISDSQGFVPDVNRANNTLVSSGLISVSMPSLTPGAPTSGTIDNGQDEYFRVDLPTGPVVRITADFASAAGGALFVRYEDVPDSATFDQVAFRPTQQEQQLVLNGTQAGTYYLLVHGRGGSTGGKPFIVTVQLVPFQILAVSPNSGSNTGQATLTIQGSQLSPNTAVSLVATDGSRRTATKVLFKDNSTLFATFDLTGLTPGAYGVRIDDNGQTATNANAFTVTAGSQGQVRVSLTSNAVLRPYQQGVVTVDYFNDGQTDAPAPLLILSSDNAGFQLPGQSTFVPDSVQLLGINQNGPAGILPPGYHGTITLKFLPKTFGAHVFSNFTLSVIPSPDTPFDWSTVKNDLRPASVPADAWDAIFANFIARVGNTLGQYQAILDDNATYLSQLGEYTVDVNRLLSFELQKADAFGAITQRYTLGAFGRGWPDPTNVRAVTDSSGNVSIEYSGRGRSFFLQPSGSYQGVPGDAATLTLVGGAYQLRETDGTVTAFNADGTLNYTQDTNGNRITAGYTGGRLTSFVDSTGDTVSFQYNAQGRISQVTDPVGRVTTYAYDASGQHLLSVSDAAGTTSYTYVTGQGAPREHALQGITFPDGSHLFFQYDVQGRLISQRRDSGAETVTYAYDTEGGVTVTDAAGGRSTYFLNEFEQVGKYEDPFGHFTTFTYGADHNLTRETGPDGITSTFTADARGNPTSAVDSLGHRLTATYDPTLNRLQGLTDPRGNTTKYSQDSHGNLLAITYPDGSKEQFTYDPTGNLTESVDGRGIPIRYTYDVHNLLIRKDFADGTHVDYAYDAHRNLTSATDAGGTTTFHYDSADRLTGVSYPNGLSLTFGYDAGGQRTQMVDQGGFTVNYQYDAAGRLAGLTDGSGNRIVAYTYDAAGRLSRKDMGNDTNTTYAYDLAGNIKSIVNSAPDNSVVSRFDYVYDDQARPISVTTLDGTTRYGYDATGQLTLISLPGGRTIIYQYDAAGNRVAVTDSGVTTPYTTNDMNQYTAVGTATYGYDAAGNLVSKIDATGTTSYTYDDLGQLVSVVSPAGTWTYQYDALGNRIAVTQNGQKTQYLTDPTGLGDAVGEYDGSGNLIAHYTHGLGLTSRVDATAAAAYYNFDLTGNTTELTGAGGSVLNSYLYLPFGETVSAAETSPNPFLYVGQWGIMVNGPGVYYMRARYYYPATGSFLSPDPLNRLGSNSYMYSGNSPVDQIDVNGLDCTIANILKEFGSLGASQLINGAFNSKGIEETLKFAKGRLADAVRSGSAEEISRWEQAVNYYAQEKGSWIAAQTGARLVQGGLKTGISGVQAQSTAQRYEAGQTDVAQVIHDVARTTASGLSVIPAFSFLRFAGVIDIGSQCLFEGSFWLYYRVKARIQGTVPRANSQTQQVRPSDPNDITGPAGFGANGFLLPDQSLPYTIHFENEAAATAPAQQVVITEQIDPGLDFRSFQVGDFAFGNVTVHVPDNQGFYSTRLDLRATLGLFVDVTAGIDVNTGVATWTFTSLDPATLDLPPDPLAGFLPPNGTPPQGEAFVTYTVRPRASVTTATRINAQASIVFDTNASVATPSIFNTIDAGPPTSSVNPLPAVTPTPNFTVSWSGADDAGGSGIASFDVFVSTDGGPFTPFLQGTTQTSAAFPGAFGHRYAFYSVAVDNVGHGQATPSGPQATTFVAGPPTSSVNPLPAVTATPSFTVSWAGTAGPGASGIVSFDVFVSTDGGPFTRWLQGTAQTSGTYAGAFGHRYGFYSVATDNLGVRQETPVAAQATTEVADMTPPTWPAGSTLQAANVQATSLMLTWSPAQDDVGVIGYRIFQGVTPVASVNGATFTAPLTGLAPQTTYTFKVEAVDVAGNLSATGPSLTVMTPQPPDPSTAYVIQLYSVVLGRKPEAAGLSHWVGLLHAGTPRQRVAQGIWESAEHRGLQVDQFYATFLHRTPDPGGRAFWVSELLRGVGETAVAVRFLTSEEYTRAHPDTGSFIDEVYADVLGRGPDQTGLTAWRTVTEQQGRSRTAEGVLTSVEAEVRLLDRYYADFLHRGADEPGEQAWLAQLQGGRLSPAQVAEAFLASDEFMANATTATP
jgi:RHS repeat-associated protein